jgi:4-carboxymuconolactone decarboxylase
VAAEPAILSFEREALVDVSAAIAVRNEAALERALRIAARVTSLEQVDEVLLQAHLFVGFPIALEALILWRRVHPSHSPAAEESSADWVTRGEAVCRTVYAANYDKLRANVEALHPDFDQWMATGGYGRVIGRPGLDLATRELCIVALLAVWNTPRQLHSHLRGALHAGASVAEVRAALDIACRHLGRVRGDEVRRLAERVLADDAAARHPRPA